MSARRKNYNGLGAMAAMAYYGISGLVKIERAMNFQNYCAVLEHNLKGSADRRIGDIFIFLYESVGYHTSPLTTN